MKENSSPNLTAQQLDELTKILGTKRDEIHRRLATAPDDRTREEEPDPMDAASEATAAAEAVGIATNDARVLREVEMALQRVANGNYGVSEETGEPIAYERLLALPWARRTAEEEERREARAR